MLNYTAAQAAALLLAWWERHSFGVEGEEVSYVMVKHDLVAHILCDFDVNKQGESCAQIVNTHLGIGGVTSLEELNQYWFNFLGYVNYVTKEEYSIYLEKVEKILPIVNNLAEVDTFVSDVEYEIKCLMVPGYEDILF